MTENTKYKYDVAISFAEEDKDAAKCLSMAFKNLGINAYYYPEFRADTLGEILEQRLAEIYSEEAAFSVVLLSENYFDEKKTYTHIELAAIRERMQKDSGRVYMLPVKLTKELSLKNYPDIAAITYADWECKPEQIAADISKLLGKKLASPTDATDGSSIVYSTGANPMVIVDDAISGITLDSLRKVGGGQVIIINKDVEEFKFSKLKKGFYACPFCLWEHEFKKYGINQCENPSCGASFYISNDDFSVSPYKSISGPEITEYNKIRARIINSTIDKDYDSAMRFCMAAEKIAPAEPSTWEHFAFTEFLIEIYKEAKSRSASREIIKHIRPHLEKSKKHGISDERLDGLLIEMANKLFAIEKARIGSLKAAYTDMSGNEIWTKYNLARVKDYLNSFEVCYSLYENVLFLEEYVLELSKPYKWLVKTMDGEIISTKACGNFRAAEKYKSLVAKIQFRKSSYVPPEISEERFALLSEEYNSYDTGDENITEGDDETFKIIST